MDNETFEKIINLIDTTIGVPFESPAMADALGMDYEMGAVIRWEHAWEVLSAPMDSEVAVWKPYIFKNLERIHASYHMINDIPT